MIDRNLELFDWRRKQKTINKYKYYKPNKEVATALEMYLYNPFAEKMPMGIMYEKGVAIVRSLTAISKVKTET